MFGLLAGIGAIGLVLVIAFVPETMSRPRTDESLVEPSELRQEEAVR
jgi:hypothetical protein